MNGNPDDGARAKAFHEAVPDRQRERLDRGGKVSTPECAVGGQKFIARSFGLHAIAVNPGLAP